MFRSRVFAGLMLMFALGMLLLTPGAKAGNTAWERKTTVTFNQPFELPGHQILAAGTYVLRALDTNAFQEMVQVTNEDGTHIYATVHTNPIYRVQIGEKTTMNFEEAGVGLPMMLKNWYHPGEKAGHEFPYSWE